MRLLIFVFPFFFALPSLVAQQQPPPRRDSIVVTGVYEPVPLEEADRPVRSLEVRGLELLANSLVDFLRLEPSVDLRQRGPNGVQADVSMRGGTFGQTLILLDGMRVNDAQTGHHNLDLPLPLESVSRVEILPGASSTLYGSDAVGGVVHFLTQPPDFSEFRLRTALGNFGVNQQSATATVATRRLTEQLTFARDFSSGFRPDRDYRTLAAASTTRYSSSWGTTNLLLAHSDRPFGADQFYGPFNSWERTRTWFVGLRQALGTATELSFALRRHTDLFVLSRDHPETYTNRHALKTFQSALRRRERVAKNARLYWGVEGYRDVISSNNLGDHARGRMAGYVALDVRALQRFSFSLGVREEIYRAVQGQFSPSLSAGYWVNSHLKLRAGTSRAFRLPSLTDLYYHDPTTRGSPDLRPERARSFEAGLGWHAGTRLRGGLTVFQRNEQDVIDYARRSPLDIWQATNLQRLRFRGLEGSLAASLGRSQQVEIRYAALRGLREQLGTIESRYVFNYPLHSAVVSWQAALPHGWVARSRLGALNCYARQPYALWDLYLARDVGRLRPFLQLTNLTNTLYEEIPRVPMPGRGVIFGLEISVLRRKK